MTTRKEMIEECDRMRDMLDAWRNSGILTVNEHYALSDIALAVIDFRKRLKKHAEGASDERLRPQMSAGVPRRGLAVSPVQGRVLMRHRVPREVRGRGEDVLAPPCAEDVGGGARGMTRRTVNFRIRNDALGETCGHHHHSRDKALGCIVHMGWDPDDCTVEMFDDNRNRKRSIHCKHRKTRGTRQEENRGHNHL